MKKVLLWVVGVTIVLALIGKIGLSIEKGNAKAVTPYFDLKAVSGKSERDIELLLGEAKDVGKWKDRRSGCEACPKRSYQDGKYEIIFIDNMADRITINEADTLEFRAESVLGSLGLPERKPDFETPSVMKWNGYEGIRTISAFSNGKGGVDYILVLSKAE